MNVWVNDRRVIDVPERTLGIAIGTLGLCGLLGIGLLEALAYFARR